ncbi:hypothetical protein KAR91_87755 [Candidatus Pacearchaeota archaeon]|nr:hypothetical protein [Candidatus Pacearchaeota archaeon]
MFKITEKDRIVKRLEKDNKKSIMKFLKTTKPDGFFFNIPQGAFSRMGISDILGLYQGQFFAFETKSKVGIPTALQKVFLRLVTYAGGIAGVVRTVADVKELLHLYTRGYLLGVVQGHRNNGSLMLAKIYLKFCTPKQVLKLLNRWNEKNRPPLAEEEITSIIIRPLISP